MHKTLDEGNYTQVPLCIGCKYVQEIEYETSACNCLNWKTVFRSIIFHDVNHFYPSTRGFSLNNILCSPKLRSVK